MTYWDKLKDLQPYSFMLNACGGVARVADSVGGWLERHKVQELIEAADTDLAAAQQEIARLRAALERYRREVPLGHQPHMLAHVVDEMLDTK